MTRQPPCAGCLGSLECWVCEGTGAAETGFGLVACTSCAGTRACQYCEAGRRAAERTG